MSTSQVSRVWLILSYFRHLKYMYLHSHYKQEINLANKMKVPVLGEESAPLNLRQIISNLVLRWNCADRGTLPSSSYTGSSSWLAKQNRSVCCRPSLREFFSPFPKQSIKSISTASCWLLPWDLFSLTPLRPELQSYRSAVSVQDVDLKHELPVSRQGTQYSTEETFTKVFQTVPTL